MSQQNDELSYADLTTSKPSKLKQSSIGRKVEAEANLENEPDSREDAPFSRLQRVVGLFTVSPVS